MDIEDAWDAFRKDHPIQKSSVAEKLDVLAAQLNEIQTDTKRTAEIVPKILGDESALGNVAAQPMDPMGGGMDPTAIMGDMPPGEPGAEAMGEPTMDEGVEPPMSGDLGETGTGDDFMANDMDEQPIPEASAEGAPVDDLGGEDISLGTEGDDLGSEDVGEDIGAEDIGTDDLGGGIGGEDVATGEDLGMGGDSTSLIKEIINEEIEDGNYERARKLLEALESMEGGSDEDLGLDDDLGLEDTGPEDVGAEGAGPVEDPFKESAIAKGDIAAPNAGMDAQSPGMIQESEEGVGATVAEKIAVETANAVEGIVESVLGEGEEEKEESAEPEDVAEVEVEVAPEADEAEEEKEDTVEEHPFEECGACDQVNKSAESGNAFSFRDIYSANLAGRDLVGEALMKSAVENDDPLAAIHPRTSMRQSFIKSMDQLSQVHPARELITGNAPEGKEQLDEVDEKKTVSGGPESVRGSVDAPKQSGADKLDEVDKEKPKSEHPPHEGDQLDDVGKTKQAHAKEGKDQLDTVDEEKSASGSTAKPKDQLDDVNAASYKKSEENGRTIMSFRDMQAIFKSGSRPTADTSMNGDIVRPEPGAIIKSATNDPPVRMGRGIDPMKVVEQDLADYHAFMQAQKRL